jgi:hypothetical protein
MLSGLFIFASTLLDFITDGRAAPQGKLETVLGGHAGLDALYMRVFSAVGSVKEFHQVIGTIVHPRLKQRLRFKPKTVCMRC